MGSSAKNLYSFCCCFVCISTGTEETGAASGKSLQILADRVYKQE